MCSDREIGTMKAITLRLEESTIESLDSEAAEHGVSRSEYDERRERVERLEAENDRLRGETYMILE